MDAMTTSLLDMTIVAQTIAVHHIKDQGPTVDTVPVVATMTAVTAISIAAGTIIVVRTTIVITDVSTTLCSNENSSNWVL